jgi:4,5-DOPA dioxygenase extradiol
MTPFPSVFISHGSPMMIVEDSPARRFLQGLGRDLGRPEAILVASGHWQTEGLGIVASERPETIYDFYGFPAPLYEIDYPAPGAPGLAGCAQELLGTGGIDATLTEGWGLDHGAWVPLHLMYPDATIPVAQISIETGLGPARQLALGEALAPLREDGVLIMGSGNLTHNLREMRRDQPAEVPPDWVRVFSDWVFDAITEGRIGDLANYREMAPEGRRNHPTEDHFLPLFTAIGAAGPGAKAERIHASYSHSALSMDAYKFH